MPLSTKTMTTTLAEKRPPVHLETIDRPSVRQFVAAHSQYLLDAIAAGRNPHEITLDRQDQVNAFAATLSASEAERFYNLYTEELNASTQASLDKTAHLNAQVVAKTGQVTTWLSLIVFFVFLVSLIRIFR